MNGLLLTHSGSKFAAAARKKKLFWRFFCAFQLFVICDEVHALCFISNAALCFSKQRATLLIKHNASSYIRSKKAARIICAMIFDSKTTMLFFK